MSSHVIGLTKEAYDLLIQQKREGYPLKRLASEPIIEKYKPLAQAEPAPQAATAKQGER
jgi:hypothetical protein